MQNQLILVFILFILLSCSKEKKASISVSEDTKILEIIGPDSALVGEQVSLNLPLKNCLNPFLIRENAWGIEQKKVENSAIFYTSDASGLVDFKLLCEGQEKASKQIYFIPGKAAYPLYSNVGAKSIISNGTDWASFDLLAEDKYGNAVIDGTPVEFKLLRPDTRVEVKNSIVKNGVSTARIISQLTVGKTVAGALIDGIASEEKELIEQSSFPTDFSISLVSSTYLADGRQTFRVKTNSLKDRNGNTVVDGTIINFFVYDANSSIRQMKAYTLNGISIIDFQNPINSGSLEIYGQVYGGGKSNTLKINFESLVKDIPVKLNTRKKEIIIGPLVESLNQLVPNGTPVKLKINNKVPVEKTVEEGMVAFSYEEIFSKNLILEISIGNIISKRQFDLE